MVSIAPKGLITVTSAPRIMYRREDCGPKYSRTAAILTPVYEEFEIKIATV